jgi:hypothetical protein
MTTWQSNNFSDDKLASPTEDASSNEGVNNQQDFEKGETRQESLGDNGHALEKVKSSASRKADIDPFGEPPDGGLNAWLKVLGCFLLYSNIW